MFCKTKHLVLNLGEHMVNMPNPHPQRFSHTSPPLCVKIYISHLAWWMDIPLTIIKLWFLPMLFSYSFLREPLVWSGSNILKFMWWFLGYGLELGFFKIWTLWFRFYHIFSKSKTFPTSWCQLRFGLRKPNLELLIFILQTGYPHKFDFYVGFCDWV